LWFALQCPGARVLLDTLAVALVELQKKSGWKTNPEVLAVVRDIHLFLGWSYLQGNFFSESAGWIAKSDKLFPERSERLTLRRELMGRLRERHLSNDYVAQAKLLLSDASIAPFGGVVLDTIGEVYATIPVKERVGLVASVLKALVADPRIGCALVMWQCPELFASKKEARSWAQKILPENLSFAPPMQADAFVALGRAAEWERDWETMVARAQDALRSAADHHGAVFLLARSCLYQAGSNLPEELKTITVPDGPGWRLLLHQCALHEQGSIGNAKAVVSELSEIAKSGDPLELDLAIRLLERALTLSLDRLPERGVVAQHAELSALLLNSAGKVSGQLPFFRCSCSQCGEVLEFSRDDAKNNAACPHCKRNTRLLVPRSVVALLPWAELNVALKELQVDGDYAKAFRRLENPELADYAPAGLLAQVARLLAGSPNTSTGDGDEKSLLPAFESALNAVLGRPEPAVPWEALRAALSAELADPFLQQFPQLVAGGEVLAQVVRLLGGDATNKEAILYCHVPANAPRWVGWLHARLGLLVGSIIPSDKVPLGASIAAVSGNESKLGSLLDAVCTNEREIESRYASARTALAQGLPPKAIKILGAIDKEIDSACVLTKLWWRPLCTYWLGVAYAHEQSAEATEVLESLVGGIRSHEAIGQLALLDLQKGDTTAALQRLAGGSDQVPSVRYARAVALSRTGKPDEACELLGSAEAKDCFVGTPYALAAIRLLATILERCGNRDWAIRSHEKVLSLQPGDEISVLRLVRLGGEIAYENFVASGSPTDVSGDAKLLAGLVPKAKSGTAQKNAFSLLLDFLNSSSASATLVQLADRVDALIAEPEMRIWWRQLLAAGLLRAHDPANALKILTDSDGAPTPPAVERSRAILKIWREFMDRVDQNSRAKTAKELEDLARTLHAFSPDDAVAHLWRMLAQLGASLSRSETVPPEQWRALADSPMAHVPFLFNADPGIRRAAAEALHPVITSNRSRWSEEPQLLLNALTAWAMANDEAFLEHYAILEPILDELPVAGRDLWLTAALVRYAKKDWKDLLDHFPDCVADMSDPVVKLVVELASAREAADEALKTDKKDQALKKIKSVRNNLQDLLEAIGPSAQPNA